MVDRRTRGRSARRGPGRGVDPAPDPRGVDAAPHVRYLPPVSRTSDAPVADRDGELDVQPGLAAGSIGFADALAIGINSTSPAYSLAAVLAPMVVIVGVAAPGILIASFVPMLLIASAFYYLNRVDPDCGTTFSWTTRALGPWFGWIGGWAVAMTGVLVVGSLADVAVRFLLLSVGLDDLAATNALVIPLTVLLVVVMTAICVVGTELSAKFQNVLVLAQVLALATFIVVALVRVYGGDAGTGTDLPSLSWLNPFAAGGAGLSAGLLLGVFAYWGWESAVNLSEETRDSTEAPGRAGLLSTVILVALYVLTAVSVIAFTGVGYLRDNADEAAFLFADVADQVLGPFKWLLLLAVATSAIASTQTTIIPASRTLLSMGRRGNALPGAFARISPRFRTPAFATWCVAIVASGWYVIANLISENALFDSLSALSLLIAFYYALTGIACAVYYRRELLRSARSLLLIGVGPVVGALLLVWLLVLSVRDLADPSQSFTGASWFGLSPPLVIGIAIFGIGAVVMVVSRLRGVPFWAERASVVDPARAGTRHDGERP